MQNILQTVMSRANMGLLWALADKSTPVAL